VFADRRVIVTLPLGVWKAAPGQVGAVRLIPALAQDKITTMDKLEMGRVIRLVLRTASLLGNDFSADDKSKTLSDMSFLFSDDPWFPVVDENAGSGTSAHRLGTIRVRRSAIGQGSLVCYPSRGSLSSSLLDVSLENLDGWLEGAHFHDCRVIPSRGCLQLWQGGANGAHEALARPVDNTLFLRAKRPT
jgi:hypothetical protein